LSGFAEDIVRQDFHAIVTTGSTLTSAIQKATAVLQAQQEIARRTPIIMTTDDGDCAGAGLVQSLGRPGTNVTGLTSRFSYVSGTRLELLAELCDGLQRVGIVWNPDVADKHLDWQQLHIANARLAVQLLSLEIRVPTDIPSAFERAQAEQ